MTSAPQTRALGKTGLQVPALGIGTNKWRLGRNDASVFETYRACLDAGINFIDTAELYAFGKSERLIGECLRRDGRAAIVASKFMPFFGRTSGRALLKALEASRVRLGLETIDLYFIHYPFRFANMDALADALIEAVRSGKARHVAVSNFSAAEMRRVADRLARANIPLAANEVEYSLLARKAETNGVLDACREIGASLIAYFPLGAGRLTQTSSAPVQKAVAEIAAARGVAPSQVALNWLLARDPCVIPIPGASRVENARKNIATLNWRLSEAEFAALTAA